MPDYEAKQPPFGREGAISATIPTGEMKALLGYAGRQNFAIGFDQNPFSSSVVTFPAQCSLEDAQRFLDGFKAEKEAWIAAQRQEVENDLGRALTEADMKHVRIDFATKTKNMSGPVTFEIVQRKRANEPKE